MLVNVGDIVVYSLTYRTETPVVRREVIDSKLVETPEAPLPHHMYFISVGKVLAKEGHYAIIAIAEATKLPFAPENVPSQYQCDEYLSPEGDNVRRLKVPLRLISRVVKPTQVVEEYYVQGMKSVVQPNFIAKLDEDIDGNVLFARSIAVDLRSEHKREFRYIAVTNDLVTKEFLAENHTVKVTPLDPKDEAVAHILKENPNAVWLSKRPVESITLKYDLPLNTRITHTGWSLDEYQQHIKSAIFKELSDLRCDILTKLKSSKFSPEGYFAFTTDNVYLDARSFMGTVFFDPDILEFDIAHPDENIRSEQNTEEFFVKLFLKRDFSYFITKYPIITSTGKKMIGFCNESVQLLNLMTLLNEGLQAPLFEGNLQRALALIRGKEGHPERLDLIAKVYLDPFSNEEDVQDLRKKWLWWLPSLSK